MYPYICTFVTLQKWKEGNLTFLGPTCTWENSAKGHGIQSNLQYCKAITCLPNTVQENVPKETPVCGNIPLLESWPDIYMISRVWMMGTGKEVGRGREDSRAGGRGRKEGGDLDRGGSVNSPRGASPPPSSSPPQFILLPILD